MTPTVLFFHWRFCTNFFFGLIDITRKTGNIFSFFYNFRSTILTKVWTDCGHVACKLTPNFLWRTWYLPLDKGCTDAQQRYKNTGNKSGDNHRVSFGHVGKELITRVAHYSKLIKLITVVHYSHLCLTTQVAGTIAIHLKLLILITTKLTDKHKISVI